MARSMNFVLVTAGLAALGCAGDDLLVPSSARLEITTSTSGPEPDPDGYMVSVDGGAEIPVAVNGTLSQEDMDPGAHQVRLSGISDNCSVSGENPREISVAAGETGTVAFQLTCTPTTGSLQVTSSTSGPSTDPDGYNISVDGSEGGALGVSGSVTLEGLAAGDHIVGLGGIAGNCGVEGDNPRTVTVVAGENTTAAFQISCVAPPAETGSVHLTVSTSGPNPDSDGYTYTVDGGSSQPIGSNASTTITAVAAGAHSIGLSGVAENCTVQGDNPRPVTVTTGATVELTFALTCAPTTSTLQITTNTTGPNPDPDGYTISVDDGAPQPIETNGSLTLAELAPGSHSVALAGLASNCSAQGDNPRTVEVTAGGTATVQFVVDCPAVSAMTWTPIPLPAGFKAASVWASSPTNIYVTGEDANDDRPLANVVLHYDGQQWREQFLGTHFVNSSVWGISPTEIFAVLSEYVAHYNGTTWQDISPDDAQPGYETVWGTSPHDLFIGGSAGCCPENGVIRHYDGTSWNYMEGDLPGSYGRVTDMSGISSTDIYAVGFESQYDIAPEDVTAITMVLHYDGSRWTRSFETEYDYDAPGDGYFINAVWANASNDVFAVGTRGRILHYAGGSWSQMTSPASGNLSDLWGNSSSNTYAVGEDGILRYDGTRWTIINPTPATRIWGTTTDVFAVVDGAILHGR